MSNLFDLLTGLKKREQRRTVSPLVESSVRKASKERKKFYFVLAILLISTIAVGLILTKILTPVQRKKTIIAEHRPSVEVKKEKAINNITEDKKKTLPEKQKFSIPKETLKTAKKELNTSISKNLEPSSQKKKTVKDKQNTEKAVSKKPPPIKNSPAIEPTEKNLSYIYRAEAYERDGNIAKALSELKKASLADPSDHRLLNKIASLYIRIGNCEEAFKYLRKALKKKPNYVYALVNLSICYEKAGDITNAKEILLRAYRISPINGYVNYNLGVLYEKSEDLALSYKYYRNVTNINNGKIKFLAMLAMARVKEKIGDIEESYHLYKWLVEREDIPLQIKNTAKECIKRIERNMNQK
jgi:tetratricopeptide (TPR) repeat protein